MTTHYLSGKYLKGHLDDKDTELAKAYPEIKCIGEAAELHLRLLIEQRRTKHMRMKIPLG
jgi:hypothetical protein